MSAAADFKVALDSALESPTPFAAEAVEGVGGQTVELGSFVKNIIASLKSLAITSIDTPAEREQIISYVMTLADTLVAPTIPFGWRFVRPFVENLVRNLIENLANL